MKSLSLARFLVFTPIIALLALGICALSLPDIFTPSTTAFIVLVYTAAVYALCLIKRPVWRKLIGGVETYDTPPVSFVRLTLFTSTFALGAFTHAFGGTAEAVAYAGLLIASGTLMFLPHIICDMFLENTRPADVSTIARPPSPVQIMRSCRDISYVLKCATAANLVVAAAADTYAPNYAGVHGFTLAYVVSLCLIICGGFFYKYTWHALMHAKTEGNRLQWAETLEELKRREPVFALYFSGNDARSYHVTMWLPHLRALNRSFFIITREAQHMEALRGLTDVPIVHAASVDDLSSLFLPGLRCAFYVNNGMKNVHMVRNERIAHVQLLHGDSDKPASYHPANRMFTHVFVAGQLAIDRYTRNGVHIPRESFRVVGRPQVGGIRPAEGPARGHGLSIAYLTTWWGDYEEVYLSSLATAAQLVEKLRGLPQCAEVTFKPHPLSMTSAAMRPYVKDVTRALSEPHPGKPEGVFAKTTASLEDIYNRAHIMISDISSVAVDFLYSGKPLIVTNPLNLKEDELRRKYPSLAAAYILSPDHTNLLDILEDITTRDSMKEARMALRSQLFGDIGHPPGSLFKKACLEILDGPRVAETADLVILKTA
jgi:hypothetical protein